MCSSLETVQKPQPHFSVSEKTPLYLRELWTPTNSQLSQLSFESINRGDIRQNHKKADCAKKRGKERFFVLMTVGLEFSRLKRSLQGSEANLESSRLLSAPQPLPLR